jgi:hypothetical protein
MHMPPSFWPTLTASSMLLPRIRAPTTPPAKASPAPLVSTMSSLAILAVSISRVRPPSTTIVGSEPCVMMTVRAPCSSLGEAASFSAMALRSEVPYECASAYATASDSLPITSDA